METCTAVQSKHIFNVFNIYIHLSEAQIQCSASHTYWYHMTWSN